MKQQKIDIIITDDHKLFRKGIKAILSDFEFINTIHEAGNGKELIDLLGSLKKLPEIILLDLKMPVMDGMEAAGIIKKLYPDLKIIILTMEDDEQIILHMINEGVNGYLMKNAEPEELEKALQMLLSHEFYFADNISNLVLSNIHFKRKLELKLNYNLSEKEIEVLKLICKEFTAGEIADKLSLSVRTIEGYKGKLLEKTGAKNMAGLVVFAIKNEIVIL